MLRSCFQCRKPISDRWSLLCHSLPDRRSRTSPALLEAAPGRIAGLFFFYCLFSLHRGWIAHALQNPIDLSGVLGLGHNFNCTRLFHPIDDGIIEDAVLLGLPLEAFQIFLLHGDDSHFLSIVDEAFQVGLTSQLLIIVHQGYQQSREILRSQSGQLHRTLGDLNSLPYHQVGGFSTCTHFWIPPFSALAVFSAEP